MNETITTAITYARKSVKIKDLSSEESISYQQVNMDEYANQQNYKVIKRYSDIGYTGVSVNRPELIEMLNDLENNPVDILLIYSVDRFGRDLRNNIETMLSIFDSVKQVIFITENLKSSSEYFKMFFLLLTAMSQEERVRLLKRLADGRRAKVLNRLTYDGKYPLGYVKESNGIKIQPASIETTGDEKKHQEILTVQYIFYCYLMKLSLRSIANLLTQKFGYTKRGVKWSYKSVQYILRNPHYSGYLSGTLEKKYHYFEETENVAAIIDPLFHQKILKMLEYEKSGRKSKNNKGLPLFCLCYQCGDFLVDNKQSIECRKCKYSTEKEPLVMKLIKDTSRLISSKYKQKKEELIKGLSKQYKIRINSLLRLKKQQELNKSFIENNDEFEVDSVERMISINTKMMNEVTKELYLYHKLEERLMNINSKKETHDDSFLINLPYLMVIDWVQQSVYLAFHPQVIRGINYGG